MALLGEMEYWIWYSRTVMENNEKTLVILLFTDFPVQ